MYIKHIEQSFAHCAKHFKLSYMNIKFQNGGNYYKYKGYGAGGNFSLIILSEP